jgi:hypothetical protein
MKLSKVFLKHFKYPLHLATEGWRHDTQHNDIQHNDTRHNVIQHNNN